MGPNVRSELDMSKHIAVIPGDGVGREVVPIGLEVLAAATAGLDFEELPWGCDYYERTGRMMPKDGIEQLRQFDAIYLGAVGWPTVPDHISLWGLLLPIRQRLNLSVNIRPVKLLSGVRSPLLAREPDAVDMLFVRENTEGEYTGAGGRVHCDGPDEMAVETSVFSRRAIEKAARHAYNLATQRRRRLINVTKSNASRHAYVFWDEVVEGVGPEYPSVKVERVLVDAMAARMVSHPESIDVAVGSNLFGDILTDLGAAIQGGMGVAASANLNLDGDQPSLFEPVHGSAPDIAGRSMANPIGAILSGALMLEHLGQSQAAALVEASVAVVTRHGLHMTRDLGGQASTGEVGEAVMEAISSLKAHSRTV